MQSDLFKQSTNSLQNLVLEVEKQKLACEDQITKDSYDIVLIVLSSLGLISYT